MSLGGELLDEAPRATGERRHPSIVDVHLMHPAECVSVKRLDLGISQLAKAHHNAP